MKDCLKEEGLPEKNEGLFEGVKDWSKVPRTA